jgi:chemotaxis protein CheD
MIYKNNLETYFIPIGGLYVTKEPMLLQTVLGSCVSATLYDTKNSYGGMNHIVLPGAFLQDDANDFFDRKDCKYGIFSMEKLIYDMLNLGCNKKDIVARIFGGSYMGRRNKIMDIQAPNVEFVQHFLEMSKIKIIEELTLQEEALKICFSTKTGDVEIKKLEIRDYGNQ